MTVAPGLQGGNDGFQRLSVLGEPIFDTRWHLRIDGAGHQTIMFKLAQLVGEHALRDVGQHALQRIEAQHLPGEQMVEDDPLPLAADQVQCGFHRTAGGTVESGVRGSCHGERNRRRTTRCRARGGGTYRAGRLLPTDLKQPRDGHAALAGRCSQESRDYSVRAHGQYIFRHYVRFMCVLAGCDGKDQHCRHANTFCKENIHESHRFQPTPAHFR